jgi:hypothetical protein
VTKVYKALLRLYPWDYATAFSADMTGVFHQACEERKRRGWFPLIRFVTNEFNGLILSIAREWVAKLTTDDSLRGRHLPDWRKMRPVGVPPEVWFAPLRYEHSKGTSITEEQADS